MPPALSNRGSPHISTSDVMLVQETLRVQKLYIGEIDGIPSSETLRAVREYKKRHKLAVNNELTDEFVQHVRDAY